MPRECNCGDVFESEQDLVAHASELLRHEANLAEKLRNGESTSFQCPIPLCKKGTTGIVPHMQHLSKHKRKGELDVSENFDASLPQSCASVQSDAVPGDALFLLFCHLCNFKTFEGKKEYLRHLEDAEDRHRSTLVATYPAINVMECPICNIPISGSINYKDHMQSRKHINRVTQPKSRMNGVPPPQPS